MAEKDIYASGVTMGPMDTMGPLGEQENALSKTMGPSGGIGPEPPSVPGPGTTREPAPGREPDVDPDAQLREPAYRDTPGIPSVLEAGKSYKDAADYALRREAPGFAGYEKTLEDPDVAAAEEFITAETTIAGNLEKYLDPDSALNRMAVARQRAKAQAAGASMSSMEVGATQAALYQQAGEFAAKDVEHASQAQLQEQQAKNKQTQIQQEAQVAGDLNVQTAKIRDEQQKIENSWEATMTGLSADKQKEMTILKENFETTRQNSMNALQMALQDGQINADLSIMVMNNANQRLNNWSLSVQELTQDEEWMAMMGDKADSFFNDQLKVVTSGIAFDAAAVGLSEEYSSYIKDLWEANVFG